LEDNQWRCRLDPKKSRRELFQRIFPLGRAKDLSAPLYLQRNYMNTQWYMFRLPFSVAQWGCNL
jgi:hypothetical protein